MARFAILNDDNKVVNIAIGDEPMPQNWIVIDDDSPVTIGWTLNDGEWAEPTTVTPVFLDSILVKANGVDAQFYAGNHYANVDDSISLAADMVDGNGDLRADISFPLTLKLPVVRHADGKPTTDEIYMNFTVTAGKASATVASIKNSGDWKILIKRLNVALERMFEATNVPKQAWFKIVANDITIIV